MFSSSKIVLPRQSNSNHQETGNSGRFPSTCSGWQECKVRGTSNRQFVADLNKRECYLAKRALATDRKLVELSTWRAPRLLWFKAFTLHGEAGNSIDNLEVNFCFVWVQVRRRFENSWQLSQRTCLGKQARVRTDAQLNISALSWK